jgi:hypothetical protein
MRHETSPDSSRFAGGLAVYTTIYPGVECYLADWYHSLLRQTDHDFQLWIGLDMIGREEVENALGSDLRANWMPASLHATPAQVRQQALSEIVKTCLAVVLVDSDDLLHPTRVEAARAALLESELSGCALRLVDQRGQSLGLTFDIPQQLEPEVVFPRNNIFGFSNSAYRAELLSRCLPIPCDVVLVDWYLATKAWLFGAKLSFDRVPRMDYRQHPANTARVRSPFTGEQIVSDTELVRRHFQILIEEPALGYVAERYAALKNVTQDIEEFHESVVRLSAKLDNYVKALNAMRPAPIWWNCVAYPALRHMWS